MKSTTGTAIEGTDYVLAAPTITIPAGGTTGAVEFIADEDGIYELNEKVVYELTTPTTARVILGDTRSTEVTIVDLQEPPTVSLDTPASITEGSTGIVTVRLDSEYGFPLRLTLLASRITDSVSSYRILTPTLEIAPGDTMAEFEIEAIDDDLYEEDENFRLNLRVLGAKDLLAALEPAIETATMERKVTIVDDQPKPTVSLLAITDVSEGDVALITAELTGKLAVPVVLELTATGGSAVQFTDYLLASPTLEIAAGDLTAEFEINAPADGVIDDIKTVELALTVSGSVVDVVDGIQTLTILDADALRPTLTLDTVAPIDEGTSRVVTARLTKELSTILTITVVTTLASDPTSTADRLDYSLSATTIEIPANSLDVTFTLTGTDDDVYEGEEQFILSLRPNGDQVDLGTVTRTVTIRDNDHLPSPPSLSLDEVGPLSESPAAAILTLRLSTAIKFTTTVSLSVVGGDADTDDYDLSPLSVEIGAGELTATAELHILEDELYEGPETLRLRLTGTNAIVSLVPSEQAIQLVDANPIPSVSLESIGPVTEAGGVSVVVALTVPAKFTITVSLTHGVASTADITDYRIEPSSVDIVAGQTTTIVNFYAEEDALYELPETVQLDLRAFRDVTLLSEATAAITIIDNTQTPSVSFGVLATTDAIEEGTLLNIALRLTGAVSTVDLTVALEASGTATEGDDYDRLPTLITIPAGKRTTTVELRTIDDLIDEDTETVVLDLRQVANGPRIGSPSQITIMIADNDLPTPEATLSSNTLSLTENETGTLEIVLTAVAAVDVTFTLEYLSGTADGADYRLTPEVVLIPAGADSATVSIFVEDDSYAEAEESLRLRLTSVSSGVSPTAPRVVTVTITDNDDVQVKIEGSALSVDERNPASGAALSVELTNAPNGAPEELIVDLAARGDDGGTADDVRIVDDNDMEITQVTIAAGASRVIFFVQAVDDDDLEYAETVNIYASAINSKAITDSGYDLEVLSDEGLLSGITVQDGTEGETVRVQIILSHSLPAQVPSGALSLVLLDGTTMNADVKILPRDIVADLKASKTTEVTIELTDDLLVEGVEEFTVTLRIDSTLMPDLTALFELTPAPSSFTITDNDLVTATLSRATLELSEGQTGTVEIRLTDDASEDLTFTLELDGISGDLADSDYTLTPTVVLIPAGANEATVSIFAVNDSDPEAVESFTLRLESVSTRVTIDTSQVITVTIPANDETTMPQPVADVTVTLQVSSLMVAEGSSETLFIRLSKATSEDVTVTLTVAGTATEGGDYELLPSALFVLTPGMAELAVGISTVIDGLYEGDETIEFVILTLLGPAVTGAMDRVTVTIEDRNPVPTLSLEPLMDVEEGADLTLMVTLSGELDVAVEVTVSIAQLPASVFPVVTIPARTRMFIFTIQIPDNDVYEGDQTVDLALSGTSDKGTDLTEIRESFTITENDQPTGIKVNPITPVTEGEQITVEVVLDAVSNDTVTVMLVDAFTGSAASGVDYTALSVTLSAQISVGELSVTFLIDTTGNDGLYEGDETIDLELRLMGSSSVVPVTALIRDADQPPSVRFASSQPTTVAEGSAVDIVVELDGVLTKDDVVVGFTVSGTATEGVDYDSLGRQVTISRGDRTASIRLDARTDNRYDGDVTETVEFVLTTASGGVTLSDPMKHAVTIIDNDQPDMPAAADLTATLSVDSITLPEGATRQIEIRLSGKAPSDLTFTLVQISGSATADVDYTLSPMEIVIAADEREVTVELEANNDNAVEGDESFTLQLGSVLSRVAIGTTGTITVTIPANDQRTMPGLPSAVTATLSLPTLSVLEGEARTFEIRLTGKAPSDLTFTLVGGPSGEYTLSPDPIVISKGSDNVIVTITAVNDTDPESDEVFTLSLMSDPSSSLVIIDTPSSITVTIPENDNEATNVEFVVTSATINEGDEYEIELRLVDSMGNASSYSQDIVVTLAVNTNPDTTLSEGEYLLDGEQRLSTMVTIPANESTGTVLFQSMGDNIDEPDEYITLRISAADQVAWEPNMTLRINVRDDYELMRDVTATLIVPTLNIREDEKQTLLVKLSEAPASTVTVKLTPVSGSAGADDYSLNPRVLTFTPTSSLELSVLISGVLDSLYEGPEDVVFELSVISGRAVTGAIDRVTVTIADSDPVPSLSLELSAPSVNEGDEVTVSAVLNGKRADDIDVLLEIVGGTATLADYSTPTTLLVTIPSGVTRVAFVITAAADSIYDGVDPETLELRLSVPDSGVTTAPQTLTITDIDDLPTLTLDVPMEIGEGVGALALTATLSGALDQDVVLTLSVGGEVSRDDYQLSTPMLTIPAGELTATFELVIIDDKVYEATETLVLTLSGQTTENEAFVPAEVMRMITDNDPRATIRILPIASVTEGDSLTITVVLTAASNDPVTVTLLDTRTGDAEQTDYTLPAQLIETIAPNELTATFIIMTLDDNLYEGDEEIDLQVSTNKGDTVERTARIDDEDTAPTVRFAASQPTTVPEGSSVEISVELDGAQLEYDLTVEFEVTMASTATPAEYTLSTNVVITAGTDSAMITLTADNDDLYDGSTPETVVLRLTRASGGLPGINVDTTTTHTVSIMDDQSQPTLSLEPVAPSVTEGQMVTVEAVLNGALDEPLDVMLAVTSGDATTPADYILPVMSLTIQPGETRVAFVITTVADRIYEGDPETVELTLSAPNGEVTGTALVQTLMIIDGDDLPTLTLDVPMEIGEGVGTLTLTATLSVALDVDVEVTLAVGGAVTTADYTLATPMMTIDAGDRMVTFELVITDDNRQEGNEIWTLSLSGQTAASEALATIERMLTITDNDGGVLTISLDPVATVTEGGNIEIVVNLIGGTSATEIEVTLELLSSGTARENDDYTVPAQLSTTIPVDGTEARFTVVTVDDDLYEGTTPETLAFRVTSSNAGGGPLSGEAMIRDNDDAPTVIFTDSSSSVTESGSANVEVSLVGKLSESDVVVYFTVGSTTATGDDYTSPVTLATGVTISAGTRTATITFDISADSVYDGSAPETVTLTLSSASNAVGTIALGATIIHTVTITDLQKVAPTLSLEPDAPSVTEGGSVIFTATLTGALDEPVEVLLTVTTGGDANPDDYTLPTTLLATIPAGETRVAFVITAAVDGIYEGAPETVVFTLSAPNGEVTGTALEQTLTIMDGDDLPTLSLEGVTDVPENVGTLILTARLSGVLDVDVDVTLAVNEAVYMDDYMLLIPTMTISAGAETATFELVITDDTKLEGNEILTLSLSGQTADAESLATIESMLTIIDDDGAPTILLAPVATVTEGGNIEIVVNLIGTSATEIEVTLELLSSGTARENDDYTVPTKLSTTIPADGTQARFTIVTVNDDLYEGTTPETLAFRVTSSNAGGGPMSGVAMIRDNDDAPTVIFTASSSSVTEGGAANVEVSLVGKLSESDVVVTFTVGSTTATGDDYTSPVTSVTIPAGMSTAAIKFAITQDDRHDGDAETVILTLSSASNAVGTIALGATTVHHANDN